MFTISAMKGDLEDKHAELVIQAAKPLYLHQFGQFRWIPKHTNKGSLQSAMYKLQDKFAWAQLHIVKLKDRPSLPCKTVTYGISWKSLKHMRKKNEENKSARKRWERTNDSSLTTIKPKSIAPCNAVVL